MVAELTRDKEKGGCFIHRAWVKGGFQSPNERSCKDEKEMKRKEVVDGWMTP